MTRRLVTVVSSADHVTVDFGVVTERLTGAEASGAALEPAPEEAAELRPVPRQSKLFALRQRAQVRAPGGFPPRTIDRVLLDRSYFALQAKFATRVAHIEGLAFGEACRLHTAFYALARDNDAGVAPERNDFDPCHADWLAFLEAIETGADPIDYVHSAYLAGDAQGETDSPCFTFTYWPEDELVRIHFGNDSQGTGLELRAVGDRHRELQAIFRTVARDHPEAAVVRGTSWLYHLEAYRRLFPPPFVASPQSIGYPHQFAALWAQFIDRYGVVKPALATPFVSAIETATTTAELDAAFPLDVLATTSEVGVFYDYFGVSP